MLRLNFSDNKGFILITSYMVIAVLVILTTGFAARSIGEQRVAQKEKNSIQAFWLAEAGLDKAISELPNTLSISGTLQTGAYNVPQISPIGSNRFLIISKGGVPEIDETNPNNVIHKIKAIVEQSGGSEADPTGITSVITASGDIVIKGKAGHDIGDTDDNAVFEFEEIFGISKDIMKNNATNLYTNPDNNVTPVNKITWIDTTDGLNIAADTWDGSGILVVNGDLKITGGDFYGIIWVIGTLSISGSPDIDGAIFVEGDSATKITGNPEIELDSEAISDAFDLLPASGLPFIVNWKED